LNLGENKAILGYPWFAAMQPQIDWRRGWINHSQLPIIFRTPDATKARFSPKTINIPRESCTLRIGRLYIRTATPTPQIPQQYRAYKKSLLRGSFPRVPTVQTMGSCNRSQTWHPGSTPRQTNTIMPNRATSTLKVHQRTSHTRNNPPV
jgi:hypothetical protein